MSNTEQIEALAKALRQLGYLYAKVVSNQPGMPADYSKQELLTVDVLGMNGACRMGEIAEYLGVGQSAITSLIDRLEEKGKVVRVRSKQDRRVWLVELSKAGQDLFEVQAKNYRTVAEELIVPLADEERDTFIALLARMTTATTVE
ncbi:MAG: MarR family transcriptional regulator [Bacteroidota bacterium]